jgi:hypothetical protein
MYFFLSPAILYFQKLLPQRQAQRLKSMTVLLEQKRKIMYFRKEGLPDFSG